MVRVCDSTLLLFIKRNEDAIKKYYASDDYYQLKSAGANYYFEQENE